MSGQCPQCPRLIAEITRLNIRIQQLEELRSAVIGVAALIESEYQRQTMPRTRLLQLVDERLRDAAGLPAPARRR